MDDIMEKEVITQCRKPHGEDGIKTIKSMNQGHDGLRISLRSAFQTFLSHRQKPPQTSRDARERL